MAKQTIQIADKPTLDEIKKKISDNYNILSNSTYGLSALKGYLGNSTYGLNAIKNVLSDSTYGLSAIKSYLSNSTYGLSAIKSSLTSSGVKVVKSIQRGITSFAIKSDRLDAEVSISTVNPSKCTLSFTTLLNVYSGPGYVDTFVDSVTINTNNLYFYLGKHFDETIRHANNVKIYWELVEFY